MTDLDCSMVLIFGFVVAAIWHERQSMRRWSARLRENTNAE